MSAPDKTTTTDLTGPSWRHLLELIRPVVALTIPFFALDQITKNQVVELIPQGVEIQVVPGFFNVVHVHNTGAAFGMLNGNNLFFVVLSFSALACLLVLSWRGLLRDPFTKTGTSLLIAGVLGNVTDRLMHGHVVDFLDFYWSNMHWPAFNVADSCICMAATLYVIGSFLVQTPKQAPQKQA